MYKILANTIFLGKDVHFLPDCHSTNDIAFQMVRQKKAQEGTVVICSNQTKGRGQRGNVWVSEPGKNLTLSLVLRPSFLDITEQFQLNMCVSNGIREFLQEYVPDIKVKWPNDLVVPGEGKIGGILIENSVTSEGWEFAVVGIGLNINQEKFPLPFATSLKKLTGTEFDLGELFRLLITRLEQKYIQLRKGKIKEIKTEYLNYLYSKGEWKNFGLGEDQILGKILGIDSLGQLQIEMENGEISTFGFKDIRLPLE
ncbi:biotin--[acetyl-CoA-carboxylase] ligase [Algoriphagus sp. CAU 1675]|uniref:biotin--[acetyl-CoA-carboxylase] ligase n=1 Tax=Algoriphagus sp. CAU 1675 TaxID=3032597 RepID=UPI0023D97E3A|nr:biotin--[acetyl-CoA-carboxylase] ligase [Algoriphagus sp. CAU 1675]MDF2157164.1 biotin--[acetyl-CoA-carboxylase] ligase [Algoriphagus sp. CAU 1675]